MKKEIFSLILFLILILNILTIHSQETTIIDKEDFLGTGVDLDNVPTDPSELKDQAQDQAQEYIKQEWTKIKEKSLFFKGADPVFKAFTGYEFFPTWEFILAFILSIVLMTFFFRGTNLFYKDSLISLLIGILFTTIANSAGLSRIIIPKVIEIATGRWIYLTILIGIVIIGLIELSFKYFKKMRREAALDNLGETTSKVKKATTDLEGVTKGMEKAKESFDKGAGI